MRPHCRHIKILIALLVLIVSPRAHSQTVQLIPTIRQVILSTNGTILPNSVMYVYLAGTTTPASVYSDSSGTILLQNPVPADSSGKLPPIWGLNQFLKIVWCAQNDGSACASGDILGSSDNVNPFGGGSSGSSASPFISASPNPATTGILRLASGDTTCWRNAANNANLCFSKDSNDLFSWAGGSWKLPEIAAPAGVAAFDIFWADSTAHRLKTSGNGGAAQNLVISGADINTSDQVTVTHLASALPVAQGGTGQTTLTGLPITNAVLTTPVIGGTTITNTPTLAWGAFTCYSAGDCSGVSPVTTFSLFVTQTGAITIKDFYFYAFGPSGPAGCATNGVLAIFDETGSSSLNTITMANGTASYSNTGLSINVASAHTLDLRWSTAPSGCSTFPVGNATVIYQMQ